ncbi:MAG TPA: transglycosylase SLT domain-containing protein [Pyrinomonadaceae bacterium]|nr:transglycosylase SLT domain-containing protein [Pyrinomonadaceae bacterium]
MRTRSAAIAAAFVIFSLSSQAAEPIAAVAEKIGAAMEKRQYDMAITELVRLERAERDVFEANNFDYLLGRLFERSGDVGSALARYASVTARRSIFAELALLRSSAIARATGNLFAERIYLRQLRSFSSDKIVNGYAELRLGRSTFDSGDFSRSLALLENSNPPSSNSATDPLVPDPVERENRLLIARSRLILGEASAAIVQLRSLVAGSKDPARPDDAAISAIRELDQAEADQSQERRQLPTLSDQEHFQRALAFQFNRELSRTRSHLEAVIRTRPDSPLVPEAVYRIGQTFSMENNFSEAIKWFERALEQYPDHHLAPDALLQAAAAYSRVGKSRESVRRYQDFIARFKDHARIDRAYLNIVDVMRDAGEETEALKWAGRSQEMFRGKIAEAQGAFAEARIHITRNNWDDGLAVLNRLSSMSELGGASVPGGTTRQEITFLKAFILEQKRDFERAIETYLSIPDGRNEYYGWRATERLRGLSTDAQAKTIAAARLDRSIAESNGKDPDSNRRNLQAAIRLSSDPDQRKKLLEGLKVAYSVLPAYKKVPGQSVKPPRLREAISSPSSIGKRDAGKSLLSELLFLRLYDEAAPRFNATLRERPAEGSDIGFTSAWVNARGDRAHRALSFAEPLWRDVPSDYQIELIPHQHRQLLYPVPFPDLLTRHAAASNADVLILLSIARQESAFRTDARSSAAARGMMQFISTTTDKIASELGRLEFDQNQLYDPDTAILFGSRYTANLFRLFPNQPEAVVASYNGGEDNMRRWLNRSRSDLPDRYVPEIAFAQSKDYVYKVMANYRLYRLFYDEQLALRP